MDRTKGSEMMIRRDEGGRSLGCRGGRAGPASATWENQLDKVSLRIHSASRKQQHFLCENTISQYFHYRPSSTPRNPPTPILCFSSQAPAAVFFLFCFVFYEFLNYNFRTLIACVLITFELLSLWGFTNSPPRLNWLHKS